MSVALMVIKDAPLEWHAPQSRSRSKPTSGTSAGGMG
jgi:hypothetical protein